MSQANPPIKEADIAKHLEQWRARFKLRDNTVLGADPQMFPGFLRQGLGLFESKQDKELFTLGALTLCSGVFTKIFVRYDGQHLYAPFFTYVLGPYGVGKGGLSFTKELIWPLHLEKKEQRNAKYLAYEEALRIHESDKTKEKPERPPHELVLVPANNSKTGLIKLLADNEEKGIVFETEADTLVDALNQSHGGFSDILRKGFHHEPVSMYRSTEEKHLELCNPKLAVLLSSTWDQMQRLIPSIENGLFSRFLFYTMSVDDVFNDVFGEQHADRLPRLQQLGEQLKEWVLDHESQVHEIKFVMSKSQQKQFHSHFQQLKRNMMQYFGHETAGVVHRWAVQATRLMMTFSMLRYYEERRTGLLVECSEEDFQSAMLMIEELRFHNLEIFGKLQQSNHRVKPEYQAKAALIEKVVNLKKSGMSYTEIERLTGVPTSTAHDWIKKG